ncbi:hypothetical protein PTSG_04573 [Salpingoeca rosetta]|uniref:Uncharacterized protein n=1 Tax=Salpingoeca rosetta (strain ATCC 50818 / BSB-021) TaxID=946362 RepID=F2U7T9_SALR5|nr:uncharacterized protein PTSG_04573 [Salpingoeca rosetta]EGD72844.1 hypothetical protein PTSG_04573 [Salpingoeca rosetta]|eukprot:XP_004994667.1 hypothetical protein PTSG_04573 [Salpingoeca rosetta]
MLLPLNKHKSKASPGNTRGRYQPICAPGTLAGRAATWTPSSSERAPRHMAVEARLPSSIFLMTKTAQFVLLLDSPSKTPPPSSLRQLPRAPAHSRRFSPSPFIPATLKRTGHVCLAQHTPAHQPAMRGATPPYMLLASSSTIRISTIGTKHNLRPTCS